MLPADDRFWTAAFDPNGAFYDELRTEFRRGLVEGAETDLNWARLGLHDVTPGALWPILMSLCRHATRNAGRGQFVEALAIYINNPTSLLHGPRGAVAWSDGEKVQCAREMRELAGVLEERGDSDLAAWLISFASKLTA
jgi:hypothetical protein